MNIKTPVIGIPNYKWKKKAVKFARENPFINDLKINNFSMNHGNINHSTSQVPYLINTNINWYVELKDLSIFLKMHFDKVEHVNVNKEKEEEKIDLDLDPEEVRKYLEVDYYVYNEILNSHHLWKWQNGKIF